MWIVVVVAFALRLLALAAVWGRTSIGDPATNLELARNMLAGQGYGFIDPTYGNMAQKALFPPLYPALLAAIGFFVPLAQPTIFAAQFGVDLATAWVIARLASRMRLKPLMPAAIYLLWPSNVLFAAIPQKEGLASLLAVLAAWFAVRKSPARLGIVAGLLALAQPALATLPVIFAILLRVPVLVAGVAAGLVLLPWWLRNYLIFGTFVPLTTASGYSFWVGTFSPDGWWIPPPPRIQVTDELRFSHAAAGDAWAWITAHPLEYAKHTLNKLARGLVNGWWPVDRITRMAPPMPWFSSLALSTIALTSTLTTLGICGAIIARSTVGKLLLACALQIILFEVWFEFSERHTYFAIPFLSLGIAAGVQKITADLKGKGCLEA